MSFEVKYHYPTLDGKTKPMGPGIFNSMEAVEKYLNSYFWDDNVLLNNPAFATVYDSEMETTITVDFPDEG